MNTLYESIFIFMYLSGRLFFYDISMIINDREKRGYIKRIIYGFIITLFIENLVAGMIIFAVHVLTVLFDTFVIWRAENTKLRIYIIHILFAFFISFVTLGLIDFSSVYLLNPIMIAVFIFKADVSSLVTLPLSLKLNMLLLILSGFIFTIKEATIIIRLVLRRMSVIPAKKESPEVSDTREFDRGKLIGVLERGLIYFLIIFNQVAAIAIIIALKSIARFKEMDDKDFAEYFLIGSLLSIIIAVFPAILVKLLWSF